MAEVVNYAFTNYVNDTQKYPLHELLQITKIKIPTIETLALLTKSHEQLFSVWVNWTSYTIKTTLYIYLYVELI